MFGILLVQVTMDITMVLYEAPQVFLLSTVTHTDTVTTQDTGEILHTANLLDGIGLRMIILLATTFTQSTDGVTTPLHGNGAVTLLLKDS